MDNTINQSIDNITLKQWQSIFELIPVIEQTTNFGGYVPGDMSSDKTFTYKGFQSSEIVNEFLERAYKNNIVLSFDWMQWEEGKKIVESKTKDFTGFNKYTLCKLLVVHIRNDRFCDGWLISRFTDDTILNILKKLRDIITN